MASHSTRAEGDELSQDEARVLKVCDAVLGALSMAWCLLGTLGAFLGDVRLITVFLLWSIPAFNIPLSRIGGSWNTKLREIIRCAVMIPVVAALYATSGGWFDRFWFAGETMVIGQGLVWGCVTRRALGGQIVALVFGGAILAAGALSPGGLDWRASRSAAAVVMTGLIVAVVAAELGKSLRQARQRRDEAVEHKRQLEAAVSDLASMQAQLDGVLQCAPGCILMVNREGYVEFANRPLPFARENVAHANLLEQLSADVRDPVSKRLQAVLQTGEQQTLEFRDVDVAGVEHWYSVGFGAMRHEQEISGVVVVAQDATQLKRTQAEMVAAQRMAAVGTLAAGVAHEINTPLQFINDNTTFLCDAARELFGVVAKLQAAASIAEKESTSAELKAALRAAAEAEESADFSYLRDNVPMAFESCLDGLQRVTTIVRSMKEFAHPAQKEMAMVDLNHAIENTLVISRNEYKFVADLETSFAELPPVTCHVNELNQAVLNLIVNASHAIAETVAGTTRRGTLGVATRLQGDDVVISVSDTGTGIPEDIRGRIFEPFFTTKEVGKGTGQGLAQVWSSIKERHGGDVTFQSKVGEGTTFHIRVPLSSKPSTTKTPSDHRDLAADQLS